ncbi:FkbM family methyltransferase [Seonamhaeicola sediminis]|uniref:FkbM family methyltransferase n=1 Tax=Seonamhaeicola sediminis TaxID=2528206 RepID=A0A562YI46_9FLAO|nr:FkbM family methyltransferase [Seonamhaeicola sediminis]TWO34377.1 FkbM family methyltransferase [Seonamhaeicola sediminis]
MVNYRNLNINQKKKFWRENPLNGEVEIKIEGIENFIMYNENDDTVVKELYWTNHKGWELTSLLLWYDLLKANNDGVIYDIGAYTGIYSLIAAKFSKGNKVFAFDIQTNTLNRLEKNKNINKLNNICLINAACTNFNGETVFSFCEEDNIISSVASLIKKPTNDKSKEIEAVSLDSFDNENNIENLIVELLKIDVEDAELDTLEGMQRILKENKPDVLIEVNNYKKVKKVRRLFPRGYTVYNIDDDNLLLKKIRWYKKASKDRNYLFTIKKMKDIKKIFRGTIE